MSLHVCVISSVYIAQSSRRTLLAVVSSRHPRRRVPSHDMSDFTQVPVLLLYAVNSLTLKALITSSSESSVRQIAWLQAVVWVILGIWRCAQRREVLRIVTRQVSAPFYEKRAVFNELWCSASAYPRGGTAAVCPVLQLYPCTTASQLCSVGICRDRFIPFSADFSHIALQPSAQRQ